MTTPDDNPLAAAISSDSVAPELPLADLDRTDVVTLLKEQLAYFQGQAEVKGRG